MDVVPRAGKATERSHSSPVDQEAIRARTVCQAFSSLECAELCRPLFLFLLPRVPWGSCAVRNLLRVAEVPRYHVPLQLCVQVPNRYSASTRKPVPFVFLSLPSSRSHGVPKPQPFPLQAGHIHSSSRRPQPAPHYSMARFLAPFLSRPLGSFP
jgi:hypothetical protein